LISALSDFVTYFWLLELFPGLLPNVCWTLVSCPFAFWDFSCACFMAETEGAFELFAGREIFPDRSEGIDGTDWLEALAISVALDFG
jgi:hypothetical protein